jgi:hypothetical protein
MITVSFAPASMPSLLLLHYIPVELLLPDVPYLPFNFILFIIWHRVKFLLDLLYTHIDPFWFRLINVPVLFIPILMQMNPREHRCCLFVDQQEIIMHKSHNNMHKAEHINPPYYSNQFDCRLHCNTRCSDCAVASHYTSNIFSAIAFLELQSHNAISSPGSCIL